MKDFEPATRDSVFRDGVVFRRVVVSLFSWCHCHIRTHCRGRHEHTGNMLVLRHHIASINNNKTYRECVNRHWELTIFLRLKHGNKSTSGHSVAND